MQYFRSSLFVSAICMLVFTLPVAADSEARPSYLDSERKFAVSYPREMVRIDSQNPLSPFLLHSGDSGYPTFNVIVEQQTLSKPELTLERQAERVLTGYRQVGMTDAALRESKEIVLNGRKAFAFTVNYTSEGEGFSSAVTIIPGSKFLYTLTFIDRSASFSGSQGTLQSILKSFTTQDEALPEAVPGSSGSAIYLLVFVCLAALFIAFALRMRRR